MSVFYRIAHQVGFTPWEDVLAQDSATKQLSAMFDREQVIRRPPLGAALDLGCGTGKHAVDLALRGWQVTGVDLVHKALRNAQTRAQRAGVAVRFLQADVTALMTSGVGSDFRLLLDLGCFHSLSDAQRRAMGREVSAVAAADATILMLAWAPGRRGPLPRGASRTDIHAAYPGWRVIEEEAIDARMPGNLRADPRWYRLHRA